MRLARFNIQTGGTMDKRYFVGLASPSAAAVIASTVFIYPWGLQDPRVAILAIPMVLVPGFLMVSTMRFRSIKSIDVGWRRSYLALFLAALTIALIAAHPRVALVALAYTYVLWGLVMFVVARVRRKPTTQPAA
jgi:CDP-diacylglycerol--serine O-phosphatidyltransferase